MEQEIMSVDGISSASHWWQWRSQAGQGSTASNATSASSTSAAGNSIVNTGSVSAGDLSTFMQGFSADLQSMLVQLGGSTSTTAASSTTTASQSSVSTDPSSANQSSTTVHHHHHHHGGESGSSTQGAADQLVGEISQPLQGGTLTSDQISQSASAFAGDVMQALQSYGTTTPTSSEGSLVV
jgi:hypothetical protein